MKYVPYSPAPTWPKGMLTRRICRSCPFSSLDDVQREVRVRRLLVAGDLDVLELGPADHALLLLDGQRVPAVHVVQVLLRGHVAAAGEPGILVADEHRLAGRGAVGVLGAVDEAEQV